MQSKHPKGPGALVGSPPEQMFQTFQETSQSQSLSLVSNCLPTTQEVREFPPFGRDLRLAMVVPLLVSL